MNQALCCHNGADPVNSGGVRTDAPSQADIVVKHRAADHENA